MYDLGSQYRIVIDLPGFDLKHIEVGPGPIRGTLSMIAGAPAPETEGRPILSERAPPLYARTIPVAWDADAERATRSLHNGVLTVDVPKVREHAGPGAHERKRESEHASR